MKNRTLLSLLILAFLPTLAHASTSTIDTIFGMAPNDLSLNMLAQLFGDDMNGLLPASSQYAGYGLMGSMFRVFNQAVLILSSIVMFYTLLISTINTAQEGEIMGKKWSSAWIPLRTISGVGLLVPLPSGYSMIQVITMWVVVQGVGAADKVWNAVATYYSEGQFANIVCTNGAENNLDGTSTGGRCPKYALASDRAFIEKVAQAAACEATFNAYARRHLTCQSGGLPFRFLCQSDDNSEGKAFAGFTDNRRGGTNYANPNFPTSKLPSGGFSNLLIWVEECQNGASSCSRGQPKALQSYLVQASASNPRSFSGVCGTFEVRTNGATIEAGNPSNPSQSMTRQLLSETARTVINNQKLAAIRAAMDTSYDVIQKAANLSRDVNPITNTALSAEDERRYSVAYNTLQSLIDDPDSGGIDYVANAINAYNNKLNDGSLSATSLGLPSDLIAPPSITSWTNRILGSNGTGWMAAGGYYSFLASSLISNPVSAQIQSSPTYSGVSTSANNAFVQVASFLSGCFDKVASSGASYLFISSCSPGATYSSNATIPDVYGFGTATNFSYVFNKTASGLADSFIANAGGTGSNKALRLTTQVPRYNSEAAQPSARIVTQGAVGLGEGIVDFLIYTIINGGVTYQANFANPLGDMDANGDPVIRIARAGSTLLTTTENTIWATIAIIIGTGILSTVFSAIPTVMVMGNGVGMGPIGVTMMSLIQTLLTWLTPLLVPFIAIIWVGAATMAYYLPMIPYILFLFGSIGWIVGVLESMVAAPLVALGLVVPSQDELGRAGHAIMLVTNIFLRPTLMIIGFVASVLMIRIGVYLLNASFLSVFQANAGGITLFGSFAVMGLYFGLLMSVCQKCFSMIHEVPDKVLRWIGHHGQEQFGEAQGLQQAQQGFDQNAQKGQGAQVGAAQATGSLAEGSRKASQQRLMQSMGGGGNRIRAS